MLYSDGLSEAQNEEGGFFGGKAIRAVVKANAQRGCEQIHNALRETVESFTAGAVLADYITLVIFEFVSRSVGSPPFSRPLRDNPLLFYN